MMTIDLLYNILESENSAKRIEKFLIDKVIMEGSINTDIYSVNSFYIEDIISRELSTKGNGNRTKNVNILDKEKYPFQIPSNWEWERMGRIGRIVSGNSLNKSKRDSYKFNLEGIPYIANANLTVEGKEISYAGSVNIIKGVEKFNSIMQGSILICSEGGNAGKKMAITDKEIYIGNKIYAVSPLSFINIEYLHLIFRSNYFQSEFRKRMKGIIGGVSLKDFIDIPVPVPPLEIQNQIVDYFDSIRIVFLNLNLKNSEQKKYKIDFAGRLSKTYSGLDQDAFVYFEKYFEVFFENDFTIKMLKEYILHLGTSGLLSNSSSDKYGAIAQKKEVSQKSGTHLTISLDKYFPLINRNWEFYTLEELLEFGPKNGYSPVEVSHKTQTKSLKLSATTKGYFIGAESKYIDDGIPKDSYLWLKSGDVLIQRANSIDYVGISACYDGEFQEYIYPDLMMKVRPNSKINYKYLSFYLNSPFSRAYFKSNAKGANMSMPKITQGVVKKIPVLVPPMDEQLKIVQLIEQLIELINTAEELKALMNIQQVNILENICGELYENN